MILAMTAVSGREEMTRDTMRRIGGFHDLYWEGITPPPETPGGWVTHWHKGQPREVTLSYWQIITAWAGHDLMIVEDDILPCRNLAPYAEALKSKYVVQFFNGRGYTEGLHPANGLDGRGFWFTQAIYIPGILTRAIAKIYPLKWQKDCKLSNDIALGYALTELGEQVYYHRSLVQHIGVQSVGTPGAALDNRRIAHDFVGEDFNAMELL